MAVDRVRAELGLEVHTFAARPGTGLVPGMLYLVRPDGFVAAKASPTEDAVSTLGNALPGSVL